MRKYERIARIAANFSTTGELAAIEPHRGGHIHDSYRLTFDADHGGRSYLLQRINTSIFKIPEQVMENIQRVTEHIRGRLREQETPDIDRRVLTLVPARGGEPFLRAADGGCWRMYRFIEDTVSTETE